MNHSFDAFISYGRAESKAFATKLHARLVEQGLKVWFDQRDIPLAVDFQEQIYDGIEKSHNFLFIIAPHSVKSSYCLKEILWAIKQNKRIITLMHVEPNDCWDQMHPIISQINWINFREDQDDFEAAFTGLMNVIQRHRDYVEQHTQLLVKALDWERHHKQNSYLLIGEERQQAESWLKRRFPDEQPPCNPTDLHCEFISESIKNANNLMTQVFISYADEHQEVMKKIRRTLLREGFTVWTNKTDIEIGTEFQEEINKGIEGADNIIWLISPHSLQSWYCQEEISHAFAHNKRIIPLLIEPTEVDATTLISPHLSSVQFIDFTNCTDEEKYEKEVDKLLKILNQDTYYYEQHKILLVKALKWLGQKRNPSILLRGYNLNHAEAWLQVAKQRTEHPPLPLHEEFISESAKQPPESSLDVFIAYSRVDSDFARKLNDALQLQGKTTWFDQESIASGVDFEQEIDRGIETANNFLFIISPSSIHSPYCAGEVEYAASLNKRVVTVLYREVSPSELHPILANVQWIDFNRHTGDFYANFSELVRTLDTDTEHVRMHTRLLARALEWEREGRDDSFLLRGKDLEASEQWLKHSVKKEPAPTELQHQYIRVSRELPYRKPKLRTVLWASVPVAALVVLVRLTGILQPLELAAYDQLMRSRPSEAQDKRILIVEINDNDLEKQKNRYEEGQGTLRDPSLYMLLTNLQKYQPRVVALDLFRDFKAQPEALKTLLRDDNRLIGVCQLSYTSQSTNGEHQREVEPPYEIPPAQVQDRVGFSNFAPTLVDSTMVRTQPFVILNSPESSPDQKCLVHNAFSLLIARRYLEAQGKPYKPPTLTPDGKVFQDLQFGETPLKPLGMFAGGLQGNWMATKTYQTLLNYRSYQGDPRNFAPRVNLEDVLKNKIPQERVKDKIVLVGVIATSSKDYSFTPYGEMAGPIIQAQMVSQIVSAVLDGRPLIWWWPVWGDALWIWVWSAVGGMSVWSFRQPKYWVWAGGIALASLCGICYLILALQSGWLPLVPSALALVATAGSVMCITFRLRK